MKNIIIAALFVVSICTGLASSKTKSQNLPNWTKQIFYIQNIEKDNDTYTLTVVFINKRVLAKDGGLISSQQANKSDIEKMVKQSGYKFIYPNNTRTDNYPFLNYDITDKFERILPNTDIESYYKQVYKAKCWKVKK